MKKQYKILIIVFAVLLALGILKDLIIKSAVEIGASQVLGAPVHIQGMSVGIFKHTIRIKGLRVDNPNGFPAGTLMEITEAGVDYDLDALLKGKLHLPLVILKLKEMDVVKNAQGKLNVDALKISQNKGAPPKMMPFIIDTAIMDLGQVVVKDYTVTPETIVAHDIGVHNKTFKNIKSAQQFAALIMVEAMGPTALRSAAIYGAASVLGVAFLPAGVAGILLSKDNTTADFHSSYDKVYSSILGILNKSGQVESEVKDRGVIKAKVDGSNITIELTRLDKIIQVKVSARKMFIPKPEVASGLLYQLKQKVK